MIYIIYVKARFSTSQKRDRALQQVTDYLAQPGIADDLFVPAQVYPLNQGYKGWANALTAECRFRTEAVRDNLWTSLDTFLSTGNQAPVESYGEHFDQMLDAPNPDADTTRYNPVVKTWP
jgi:hypothetical protein